MHCYSFLIKRLYFCQLHSFFAAIIFSPFLLINTFVITFSRKNSTKCDEGNVIIGHFYYCIQSRTKCRCVLLQSGLLVASKRNFNIRYLKIERITNNFNFNSLLIISVLFCNIKYCTVSLKWVQTQ